MTCQRKGCSSFVGKSCLLNNTWEGDWATNTSKMTSLVSHLVSMWENSQSYGDQRQETFSGSVSKVVVERPSFPGLEHKVFDGQFDEKGWRRTLDPWDPIKHDVPEEVIQTILGKSVHICRVSSSCRWRTTLSTTEKETENWRILRLESSSF
jgi:hypothetical protein